MLTMYSLTTPSSRPPRVNCTTSATGPGRGGAAGMATEAEGSTAAGGWAAVIGAIEGGGAVGVEIGVEAGVGSGVGFVDERLPKAAGTEGA